MKKLRRINDDEWAGGVCAGIAYWLGMPAWTIRLLFFVSVFGYGIGFGFYILLWLFMPRWNVDPSDYDEVSG